MTDVDDLTDRLRAQMTAYTAHDNAPSDLPIRVRRAAAARRRRTLAAAGFCAVLAGGALVLGQQSSPARPDMLAPPAAPPPVLSLEQYDESGGSVETQSSPGQVERVQLPAAVRNDGSAPVTLLSMSVEGTRLTGSFSRRTVVPGGRQPLSLTGPVDCTGPALPDRLALRVDILTTSGPVTVTLPLPETVVAPYRMLGACSRSPEATARDDAAATAQSQVEKRAREQATQDPPPPTSPTG